MQNFHVKVYLGHITWQFQWPFYSSRILVFWKNFFLSNVLRQIGSFTSSAVLILISLMCVSKKFQLHRHSHLTWRSLVQYKFLDYSTALPNFRCTDQDCLNKLYLHADSGGGRKNPNLGSFLSVERNYSSHKIYTVTFTLIWSHKDGFLQCFCFRKVSYENTQRSFSSRYKATLPSHTVDNSDISLPQPQIGITSIDTLPVTVKCFIQIVNKTSSVLLLLLLSIQQHKPHRVGHGKKKWFSTLFSTLKYLKLIQPHGY